MNNIFLLIGLSLVLNNIKCKLVDIDIGEVIIENIEVGNVLLKV